MWAYLENGDAAVDFQFVRLCDGCVRVCAREFNQLCARA